MLDELKEYGLTVYESESPDRQLVDLSISDEEDNVAWVWGDSLSDVEFECNHPYQCIDFGDGEEQGECLLCGAYCDWHWEEEVGGEGHDEDGAYTCRVVKQHVPHKWYPRRNPGGIIEKYLDKQKESL